MSLRQHFLLLRLLFALLCGAISPSVFAQQQFRIAGVVVDSVSAAPIERVEVAIAPVADLQKATTTQSSSNGAFVFSGLSRGKYRLTAGRVGYTNQGLDQHEGFMTAVAVGPKLDSEHVRFRLSRESVISGVVSDEFGEPARGADVFLFERRLAGGSRSPQYAGQTTTDDIGEYRFSHLAPGTYFVVVHAKPWYRNDPRPLGLVRIGGNSMQYDQKLQTLILSSDQRRDILQDALQDATELSDADKSEALSEFARLNRKVTEISQPTPDPRRNVVYPISFYANADSLESATPLVLTSGSSVTADFFLHPVPALKLLVRAPASPSSQNSNSAVPSEFTPSATVTAMLQVAGTPVESLLAQPSKQFPGSFEISDAAPGEILLQSASRSAEGMRIDRTVQRVSEDNTIDLAAAGLAAVSGTVGPLPKSPPGAQAHFEVPVAAGLVFVSSEGHSTHTVTLDTQGDFSVSLRPGQYTVEVQPAQSVHISSIQATGAQLSGHSLTVPSGASVKLQVRLVQADCSVTGTARKNGRPFAGAMMILVPEDPTQDAARFHRDQSDSDGTFTMSPVLPGRYTLLALENGWDLEWSSLSVLFPYLPAGVPLDLEPASSVSTTVKVQ